MPGFLGGSTSGGGGAGGEISFPKQFIDPVTKLRVSQPETLIDTDFEYGLQPTKWETVELINNTPSFFSKSGDTTIPNIVSITTNAGTREITVTTGLDHGLAVGIPINVQGTKSITADGSYIINSIPNTTTFTYLCKDNQTETLSIEDLYTSIITGEFFQGSQLRISDSEGIITDGDPVSVLTVKTESAHGFGVNTPFYFLNLNSTVAQEFEAANTAAKSFDSSNSATAQTFDGSNTLSQIQIDFSNSAVVGTTVSNITSVSTANDTVTVSHTVDTFVGAQIGTPLYYDVSSSAGYFSSNPRGIVFLKTVDQLGSSSSTFKVSEVPNGDPIDIVSAMTGTFQIADQAKVFAGNNRNPLTETSVEVLRDPAFEFDGGNQGFVGEDGSPTDTNGVGTVIGYTGDSVTVSTTPGAGLDWYVGAMLRYQTTGSAASGLTNGNTYFVSAYTAGPTADLYTVSLKELPTSPTTLSISGGTGTQTFTKIGVSIDKDIVHVRNSNFLEKDMVEYAFPVGGRFSAASSEQEKIFYFVETAYDNHNYKLSEASYTPMVATGGNISQIQYDGRTWNVHTFTTVETTSFVVSSVGSDEGYVEYLVVAGGGGGNQGLYHGGGGGAGGFRQGSLNLTAGTYTVTVGAGGLGGNQTTANGMGKNSVFASITSLGGGYGGPGDGAGFNGGSGGGAGVRFTTVGLGTAGQGNNGGQGIVSPDFPNYGAGAGGGAGSVGGNGTRFSGGTGGLGRRSDIRGTFSYYAAGGGGSVYAGNTGGYGGSGIGGRGTDGVGAGNGVNNTGSGGGGKDGRGTQNIGSGNGGSGIVVVRYPVTPRSSNPIPMAATGGTITQIQVGAGADQVTYKVHAFTTVGTSTFTISDVGNINDGVVEYLVVGGGGGGASWVGGGGGGGGFRDGSIKLTAGSYTITVGAGGRLYENGGNSSIGNLVVATGGGFGGGWDSARLTVYSTGNTGGSSGGAGAVGDNVGGSNRTRVYSSEGVAGQGYRGGSGVRFTTDNANSHNAGGGGGAGGPGEDGSDENVTDRRWNGGPGLPSSILGTTYFFGGGGGGSSITNGIGGNGGIGGGGGGHAVRAGGGIGGGSALNSGTNGGSGTGASRFAGNGGANTGGGGGGGYTSDGLIINGTDRGGIGGSGIVVIRYPITVKAE